MTQAIIMHAIENILEKIAEQSREPVFTTGAHGFGGRKSKVEHASKGTISRRARSEQISGEKDSQPR